MSTLNALLAGHLRYHLESLKNQSLNARFNAAEWFKNNGDSLLDALERQDSKQSSDHTLVPFPVTLKFAEVRMIYCQKCGVTTSVSPASSGNQLPPCYPGVQNG